jgi:hypothetical protein
VGGLREAGPTTSGLKLVFSAEQDLLAPSTMVGSHTMFLEERSGERSFGAPLPEHVVLFRGETFAPPLVIFGKSLTHACLSATE